jgi:hypothetical protein
LSEKQHSNFLFQFFSAFFRELREILAAQQAEIALLKQILEALKNLEGPSAQSAKGELMPASIALNGHGAIFAFTEFDGLNGTGNMVPPIGVIAYASDNLAVATVDASGNVTAVGVGSANISGTDPGNGLTASDQLTVTPAIALSATGVLTANP